MADKAVVDIDKDDTNEDDSPSQSSNLDDGPPSAGTPKSAGSSSLFSSVGKDAQAQGQAGLGAEGGSQPALAMMGLASIQRGVQILSAVAPGIAPILSDLTGRLQMVLPQIVNDLAGGGMGLYPPNQQMGTPMPAPSGGAPMGGPPMPVGGVPGGMPSGPPPMQGGPPQGGPPQQPPMPPR